MMAIIAQSANSLINKQGKYTSATKTEAQKVAEIKQRLIEQNQVIPQELWFETEIDHYVNHGAGSPTYKMRYLIDDTYYN